jgi:GNAT superfamily N-acetyltransferase
MTTYHIDVDSDPQQDDLDTVERGLRAFNTPVLGPEHHQRLGIYVRDAAGVIHGGLTGETYFGWLYIADLWLADAVRGQGFGRQLMEAAEAEARRRGCKHVHLDTFQFQALSFYEHLGYTVWGTLEDFLPGHTRYYLRKAL